MEHDVGARIRVLREAADLRAQDLAARVDMDPTVLSKIENGRRAVKSAELARIADALKVSPLALLEDDPLLSSLPIAARRAGPSITSGGAYDRLLSLAELHVVLADAGIPTSPDLAFFPDVAGTHWLEAANLLADVARRELRVNATGDQRFEALADAIEGRLKVDVLVEAYPDDALSGAALTERSFPLLFVNSDFSGPRSLFTLAHELGHLLLGHLEDGIALDRELAGSTDNERMANAFAAMFLMPDDTIDKTIEHYGRRTTTIVHLAYVFGVSFETIVYRLHNLRLIDAQGRDELMRINWQQQLAHLAGDPASAGLSPSAVGRLQVRRNLKPAGRAPALLVRRAMDGFQKGAISVRPLAALIGESPDHMLQRLGNPEEFEYGRDLLESQHLTRDAEHESSEDVFAGSPV